VPTTASDLLSRVDHLRDAPPPVRQAAHELAAIARRVVAEKDAAQEWAGGFGASPTRTAPRGDDLLLRAALAAYPDRVARRREPRSSRFVLASGTGAALGRESGVREGDLIVALDLVAGARGPGSEALIRMASRIERDWILPTRREVVHQFDAGAGAVRAVERAFYMDLVLSERHVAPDSEKTGEILAAAILERGLGEEEEALVHRLRFAGLDADPSALVRLACAGKATLPARLNLGVHLPHATLRELDRLAPETLPLPSGRGARLDYREDGSVVAAVKLQELFGLADSPRLGPRKEPVTFALLSPAGRPVQTTRDLRSFWEKTYPEVRKGLRIRYPKHPWPEDPWTATPTHRTKRPARA
jgi:ATP-dependent helicase HrpB